MNMTGFAQLVRDLRTATLCKACGKTQTVVNVAGYRRPFRAEAISPETHCHCEGSPVLMHVRSMTKPYSVQQHDAILEEQEQAERQILAEAGTVADDTIVEFEGEDVRWGDLTLQDRKAFWRGGYGF